MEARPVPGAPQALALHGGSQEEEAEGTRGPHLLSLDSPEPFGVGGKMTVVCSGQWSLESLESLEFPYQISKNLLIVVTLI